MKVIFLLSILLFLFISCIYSSSRGWSFQTANHLRKKRPDAGQWIEKQIGFWKSVGPRIEQRPAGKPRGKFSRRIFPARSVHDVSLTIILIVPNNFWWAVVGKPFNLKSANILTNYPGPKYKKVSFSNPGHAHNLAKKLNDTFDCTDFSVYKLTAGELVSEEWTGKKPTLRYF